MRSILGGNAVLEKLNKRRHRQECTHTFNMSVVSAGLERIICGSCGHLSFRYLAELNGTIDRSRFLREVDRLATAG